MITKMIVNQLGMMIFGLVLEMATWQNDTLLLATSIFAIVFYLVLLYTMSWESGVSDRVKVRAGRLEYKPWKFVLVSFSANILNLALGVIATVGWLCNGLSTEVIAGREWAFNLYGVCNNIARFIEAMYAGLLYYITPNNPVPLILIVLPSLAVCGFGYYLALNGKTLRGLFGVKTAYDNVLADEHNHGGESGGAK